MMGYFSLDNNFVRNTVTLRVNRSCSEMNEKKRLLKQLMRIRFTSIRRLLRGSILRTGNAIFHRHPKSVTTVN